MSECAPDGDRQAKAPREPVSVFKHPVLPMARRQRFAQHAPWNRTARHRRRRTLGQLSPARRRGHARMRAKRSRRARQRKSRLWENQREKAKNAVFAQPCTEPQTCPCLGCGGTRCLGCWASNPPVSRCGVPSYAHTRARTLANPAKQATQATPALTGARCTQVTDG